MSNVTPITGARMSPTAVAELREHETAMTEILSAEAVLDLFLTLERNSDVAELKLGTDGEMSPFYSLIAVQGHLKRAREALERAEG